MGGVKINEAAASPSSLFGARAVNYTERRANIIKNACQAECPVQTGALRASHKVARISARKWIIVADKDYASHVFDGDGPNGPRRPNRWLLRGLDRVRAAGHAA